MLVYYELIFWLQSVVQICLYNEYFVLTGADYSASFDRSPIGCCRRFLSVFHCFSSLEFISMTELVQTEERFNDVKNALKTLNKVDFDKLISSVRFKPYFRWCLLLMLHVASRIGSP